LERGLDGGRDELRGLRVDDDVPAEQNAADDLPGVRERIVRADGSGGGTGYTRDCRRLRSWTGYWTRRICNAFYYDHRAAFDLSGPPAVIVSPTVRIYNTWSSPRPRHAADRACSYRDGTGRFPRAWFDAVPREQFPEAGGAWRVTGPGV